MLNTIRDFITIDDLMDVLEIGRNKAYELLNEGKIKAFRVGNRWKIPDTSVSDYIFSELHRR